MLTHPAAITSDGRHAAHALLEADTDLRALFGPEHGVLGTAQAGETEAAATDSSTGLPVYDTYNHSVEHLSGMLAESRIDVLAVDLQNVGARFFTYESSLYDALAAAALVGVRVCVLDRPNPLGGRAVAGPVLEEAYASFVGRAPIPVRHGMTMAELGRLFAARLGVEAPDVVPLAGWNAAELFPATALPWVPPSPNLPTPISALIYPGTCFLEGTNVSVGRGTTTPFELVGAPWLDRGFAERLRAAAPAGLAGITVREAYATPAFDRYAGQQICGAQLHVTDPDAVDPLAVGVTVLCALRDGWLGRLRFRDEHFDLLAGSDGLRTALNRGSSAEEILESWRAPALRFAEVEREPYLLYPRDGEY
ncbi:exo-beta-N-acetylmuramidase NamZ domain-containing protein [Catenulispora sp. EB89]|uniref:exo-beta-N-acetylmuramidase NamZ family protein n=1 Tax=Catenulispora sp. EB89 TaxID=3156257 RepID=UPI003513EF6C